MANECMILFTTDSQTMNRSTNPKAVYLVEGDVVTITSKDNDYIKRWGAYIENEPMWKDVHVKTKSPLSSLFGRSGYTNADWFPYDDKTKSDYQNAVKKVGGQTKTFKPK